MTDQLHQLHHHHHRGHLDVAVPVSLLVVRQRAPSARAATPLPRTDVDEGQSIITGFGVAPSLRRCLASSPPQESATGPSLLVPKWKQPAFLATTSSPSSDCLDCFQTDQLPADNLVAVTQDELISLDTISWDQPLRNGELPVTGEDVDNVPVTGECINDVVVLQTADVVDNPLPGDDPWLGNYLPDLLQAGEKLRCCNPSDCCREDYDYCNGGTGTDNATQCDTPCSTPTLRVRCAARQ